MRFAAFLVGNAAPKAWKCVKVAIRFRLLFPRSPPPRPCRESAADAKGKAEGEGGKTPNLPGKLEIYVGLDPKIDEINHRLGL